MRSTVLCFGHVLTNAMGQNRRSREAQEEVRLGSLAGCKAPTPRSASPCTAVSSLLIRMYPFVRRNLPLLGQLDHADGRLIAARAAGPASKGRLQLPDWRIMRPPNSIQRQARSCLAATAFDLQPAVTTVQALADRWRRLGRAAVAFHADRPRFCLSAIRRTGG